MVQNVFLLAKAPIYLYILICLDSFAILCLKILKGQKMQKNVFKTDEGVKIKFSGAVVKQQIIKMVENCSTGACECMSDDTKKKISNMQVDGKDGDVKLHLEGEVSKEEIEVALAKSKVLNKS